MESRCGIEPQSLANENLTIRPSRFTPTEAVFIILVFLALVKKQNDILNFCFDLPKKQNDILNFCFERP